MNIIILNKSLYNNILKHFYKFNNLLNLISNIIYIIVKTKIILIIIININIKYFQNNK